jgi:hypothetical protein
MRTFDDIDDFEGCPHTSESLQLASGTMADDMMRTYVWVSAGIVAQFQREHPDAPFKRTALWRMRPLPDYEMRELECPTCHEIHAACITCAAPTRCPSDEPGEPFTQCDHCDGDN